MLATTRRLITLPVLLSQIAAFLALGLLVTIRHQQRQDSIAQTLLPYAQAAAFAAGERMRATERQLQRLARQLPANLAQRPTVLAEMQRVQQLEGLEQVVLTTLTGEPLLDTGPQAGPRNVGEPGQEGANFSVPVVQGDGIAYVLRATLPPSRLLVSGVQLPPGWSAAVADPRGQLLASSPELSSLLEPVLDERMRQAMEQQPSGVLEVSAPRGIAVLAAYTHIDGKGWTSVVTAPRHALYAPAWRSTLTEALAGALLLVAGGWLTLRLAARNAAQLDQRQRAAEQHGMTSDNRLQAILSMAADAILVTDAQDRVVLANEPASKMFHMGGQSLLGVHVGTLLAPDTWGGYDALPDQATGQSGHARRGPGGATFPIEYSVSRFTDAAGNVFRTLIVTDVSAQKRQEDMLLEARTELDRMNHTFDRALTKEAENRQAEIARELHDAVGSSLAGVSLLLGTAYSFIREPEAAALISKSQELVMMASQQVRQIARGIMPAGDERGALLLALEQFAADLSAVPGLSCTVRSRGDFDRVSAEVGGHLFRIVQEATTNALRHGHALQVRITLAQAGPWCRLTIRDDGNGYEPANVGGTPEGLGMKSMRARAEALGGRFSVVTSPDHHLKVQVTWLCRPA